LPSYPFPAGSTTQSASAPNPVTGACPLARGESVYLFGTAPPGAQLPATTSNVVGETPAVPQASIAINVGDFQEGGPAPGVSFEGFFSGAPGVFEVDFQEADTDFDTAYILPSNAAYKVTAVVGNNFRVDLIPTGGRFMRAVLVSRANAVSLILKATRLQ